jgi:electron transfer flavoprotein alpha subunit
VNGTLVFSPGSQSAEGRQARELIGAAKALGPSGPISLVVTTPYAESYSSGSLETIGGPAAVQTVAPQGLDFRVAEDLLVDLMAADEPRLVVLPHSPDALDIAGAAAARAGFDLISDVVELTWTDEVRAVRRIRGGRLLAEMGTPADRGLLITVRSAAFPAEDGDMPGHTRLVTTGDSDLEWRLVETEGSSEATTLSEASRVIGLGRGVLAGGDLPTFEALAEQLDAVIGATRPVIDAGWVAPARLIGLSGNTIRPRIYLAFGISGAVQHIAEVHADFLIAVTDNPNAPIADVADVVVLGDAAEVAVAMVQQTAGK